MGSSIVLLGDQFPMPSQQGLRRDNGGDLGQNLPPQAFGPDGQSPALIVIEAQSPSTELLAQNPVFLAKVVNDLQLALIHPSGNGDHHKPEWVENSLDLQRPRGYGAVVGKHPTRHPRCPNSKFLSRLPSAQFAPPAPVAPPRRDPVRERSRATP
jgi:hypothetical protein